MNEYIVIAGVAAVGLICFFVFNVYHRITIKRIKTMEENVKKFLEARK